MNEIPKGLSDRVADDLPLTARIVVAREGIEALDRKLAMIVRDQADLAERVRCGEGAETEIEQQEKELRKLREQTDRQRLVLAGYVAKLEREQAA